MNRIKVLLVAPYEGLKNLVTSLYENDERFDLDAQVGDLKAGVKLIRESRGKNYEVIISRGGTAELIEQTADVPVIDIELSQYDILHAIKLSQNYSGKIAIVGFPKITERVGAICALMGYDMHINMVNSAEQVPACLSRLKADGCSLIIGDTVAVTTAREMQMNGILITSGSESIISAFREAEKICGAMANVRREACLYRDMLEVGETMVLAVNDEKQIVYMDQPEYTEAGDLPVIEGWCRVATAEVLKKGECALLRKLKGALWSVDGRRGRGEFSGLAYFYIRRGLEVTGMERSLQIQPAALYKRTANSFFYDDSPASQLIVEHIRRLSWINLPVIISGEQGTGKDAAAFEIYRRGDVGDNTLLTIDCRMLDEKQLGYLLHNEKSPIFGSGIGIYFKRVDALNHETQRALALSAGDSLLHRRNRVVYSCEEDSAQTPGKLLIPSLFNESGQQYLTLRLPSLRERANDIPSLSSIYINDLNIALGKQVAGLDQESTEMLMAFPWRANITQLKNVLRELVLITDGAFVSGGDTRRILLKEETFLVTPSSPDFLRGTLDEITTNVLRRVLAEEGGNQSNAAKRLGIGRSTMWRKLQGRNAEVGEAPVRK